MKKIFSMLMVAAIATFTFAFTTPKAFDDVFFKYVSTPTPHWESGQGSSCTGSAALCDIAFDEEYEDRAAEIQLYIEQNPNATNVPLSGVEGGVDVTVRKKP